MKNPTLLILFTLISSFAIGQKAEYFVYANNNNFAPSALKKVPLRLSEKYPNIVEEHILGLGIERRAKRSYTRRDVELGKDKGGISQEAYEDYRTYKQFRLNFQLRSNLYIYDNKDSFLIEGGNFNTMAEISYQISK